MRQIARVVKVESGDFEMVHSLGGAASGWVGETEARPETDSPTLVMIKPVVGEVYAAPKITQQLLDDSAFDIEDYINTEVSDAFETQEGEAFITGDGVQKPRGITTYDVSSAVDGTRADNAIQYVASGASGAFTSSASGDALISLVHACKPKYRKGASWLMNTGTLETIRKFKDSNGDYIWKAGLEAGQPDSLLGYPLFEDENMPDVAADSLSVAFGNFNRAYTVVDRNTRMLRDPFSDRPYVVFYSTRRVGGAMRDFRALKFLKMAAS